MSLKNDYTIKELCFPTAISSSYENKSELINCLFLMSSLVLSWTDKSHVFRHGIVNHGYLLYHVMQLKGLEAIRSKQVSMDRHELTMTILGLEGVGMLTGQ